MDAKRRTFGRAATGQRRHPVLGRPGQQLRRGPGDAPGAIRVERRDEARRRHGPAPPAPDPDHLLPGGAGDPAAQGPAVKLTELDK